MAMRAGGLPRYCRYYSLPPHPTFCSCTEHSTFLHIQCPRGMMEEAVLAASADQTQVRPWSEESHQGRSGARVIPGRAGGGPRGGD